MSTARVTAQNHWDNGIPNLGNKKEVESEMSWGGKEG